MQKEYYRQLSSPGTPLLLMIRIDTAPGADFDTVVRDHLAAARQHLAYCQENPEDPAARNRMEVATAHLARMITLATQRGIYTDTLNDNGDRPSVAAE